MTQKPKLCELRCLNHGCSWRLLQIRSGHEIIPTSYAYLGGNNKQNTEAAPRTPPGEGEGYPVYRQTVFAESTDQNLSPSAAMQERQKGRDRERKHVCVRACVRATQLHNVPPSITSSPSDNASSLIQINHTKYTRTKWYGLPQHPPPPPTTWSNSIPNLQHFTRFLRADCSKLLGTFARSSVLVYSFSLFKLPISTLPISPPTTVRKLV